MKTIARFFLFLAACSLAIGQPMVPVSNISPVNSLTLLGRYSSGTGRGQLITLGDGLVLNSYGVLSVSGSGGGFAPGDAKYILQTPNGFLANAQALSALSTGIMKVTTTTGVISSLPIPLTVDNGGSGRTSFTANAVLTGNGTGGFLSVSPGTSGNILTSNGTAWFSTTPATSGNVTAAATLDSGNIVIGQGAKTIATSSVISISGSNATVTGNLAITGGTTFNNLTTSNLSVTGNITATGVGNGTILIGNTTGTKFNVATLTAGDGVTITNGAGSITINATGTGGTVTANATLTSGRVILGGGGNIIGPNSAATNGQLLIGNTTNGNVQLSTLTAGDNIAITNSAGGITINATGSGNVSGSGLTANAIVVGGGGSAIAIGASPGTSGNILTSNGTAWTSATAPTGNVTVTGTPTSGQLAQWSSASNIVGITSANVTQGGTGLGTLTANNIITGNGTGAVTFIAPGTTGNIVTSNGTAFNSAAPTWFGSAIVSGCTTVTANSTGNLTLVAGGNITLTTDNTAKSITIAASGGGGGTTLAMTATLGSDDTYTGSTLAGLNAGATIAQWEAVYVGASSTYLLADANGSGTYPARGLAIAAYSNTDPAVIIREGPVRNDAWNWTPGGTIYLSTTPGGLTQTAPSASGDKVQQVGFALTADIAYFNFASGEFLTVQ